MRLLIQNVVIEAVIDPRLDPPVLVLEHDWSPVEPAFAHTHRFEIIEATDDERDTMTKSGYRLPDHVDAFKAA